MRNTRGISAAVCGHAPHHGACPAHEHTFTFCQIFFISGGNYTLITCIQYTTMVTHSECEISQSWRTQFSSHGALNLNRAVVPPPFPYILIQVRNLSNVISVMLNSHDVISYSHIYELTCVRNHSSVIHVELNSQKVVF